MLNYEEFLNREGTIKVSKLVISYNMYYARIVSLSYDQDWQAKTNLGNTSQTIGNVSQSLET